MALSDYHYSDCTVGEMSELAEAYAQNPPQTVHTIEGENVQGTVYMEYHVDEEALQQLVLDVFYKPVGN